MTLTGYPGSDYSTLLYSLWVKDVCFTQNLVNSVNSKMMKCLD